MDAVVTKEILSTLVAGTLWWYYIVCSIWALSLYAHAQ